MSDTTTLTVLKMFGKGRGLKFVAQVMKMPEPSIRQIATDYGVLNGNGILSPAIAEKKAAEVETAMTQTATAKAIPVREPSTTESVAPRQDPSPRATPPAPATGDATLIDCAVHRLRPDPDNPREDVGDTSELAASIERVGLLQPIVARRTASGQLFIVAGHRRWDAVRLLGWKTVPVIVRRDLRPDDVLAAMLVENSHRKDLDPIEEARGLARLKAQLGCTEAEVARRIGRHQSHVSSRLRLLSLPVDEQEQIRRGDMSVTEARDRARLASGRIGASTGRPSINHFSTVHPLAAAAKARCIRLKHDRGRGKGVGGIACGSCWESVIRADEREHIHEVSGKRGECAICGAHIATREDRSA